MILVNPNKNLTTIRLRDKTNRANDVVIKIGPEQESAEIDDKYRSQLMPYIRDFGLRIKPLKPVTSLKVEEPKVEEPKVESVPKKRSNKKKPASKKVEQKKEGSEGEE